MEHMERVEAMMEAMAREPDRVFHEVYMVFVLHDCVGLAAMSAERRGGLLDAVVMACATILCPPVAVNVLGDELYLLVQQNPWRSVQDIVEAAGSPLPQWAGDHSGTTISPEDVDEWTAAINTGEARVLFRALAGGD